LRAPEEEGVISGDGVGVRGVALDDDDDDETAEGEEEEIGGDEIGVFVVGKVGVSGSDSEGKWVGGYEGTLRCGMNQTCTD